MTTTDPIRAALEAVGPLIGAVIVVAVWAWFALGFHFVHKPTPDQLYGCTIEQQAPNGECK